MLLNRSLPVYNSDKLGLAETEQTSYPRGTVGVKTKYLKGSLFFILVVSLNRCATPQAVPQEQKTRPPESTEINKLLLELNERVQSLETKVVSVNEKLDLTRLAMDRLAAEKAIQPTEVAEIKEHPAQNSGSRAEPSLAFEDPEFGFVNDGAVQIFRKAMILFLSQKYQDATLAFSNFLEAYPDHPLAGAAQFYIGETYFKQKEYKLALQEYQSVLISYNRSSHIPDALYQISQTEEALQKTKEAAKHRQLLTSLFPQSPAAHRKIKPEIFQSPVPNLLLASPSPEPIISPLPSPLAISVPSPFPQNTILSEPITATLEVKPSSSPTPTPSLAPPQTADLKP